MSRSIWFRVPFFLFCIYSMLWSFESVASSAYRLSIKTPGDSIMRLDAMTIRTSYSNRCENLHSVLHLERSNYFPLFLHSMIIDSDSITRQAPATLNMALMFARLLTCVEVDFTKGTHSARIQVPVRWDEAVGYLVLDGEPQPASGSTLDLSNWSL